MCEINQFWASVAIVMLVISMIGNIVLIMVSIWMWKAMSIAETIRDGVGVTKAITATFMKKT